MKQTLCDQILNKLESLRGGASYADLELCRAILLLAAAEGRKWTKRFDDAKRFPDVLEETGDQLKQVQLRPAE